MPAPQAPPRFVVRLRHPQALRDAMEYAGFTVRELSEACGSMKHRSAIGHLLSGARTTCSPVLAARLERVLRLPKYALFDVSVTTTSNVVPATNRRKAA